MLSPVKSLLAASLLLLAPACDGPGKEGDSCKTPTVSSQDCEKGLKCMSCDKGPECVMPSQHQHSGRIRVDGRVCQEINDMRTTSDIPRGAVPGSNL
jgi:hypothetical protein